MDAIDALRHFFERQLGSSGDVFPDLDLSERVSTQHLVGHLIQRTVRRAALDAVVHRSARGGNSERGAEVSWKHCLMIAALTELRSLELPGRNPV